MQNALLDDEFPLVAYRPAARTLPSKKARRLRIAWFILGAISGILLSTIFNWALSGSESTSFADTANRHKVVAALGSVLEEKKALPSPPANTPFVIPPPKPTLPSRFNLTVQKGDTLTTLLTAKGVNYQEAIGIVEALRPHYNPRRMSVGQSVDLRLNESKFGLADFDVESLTIKLSPLESIELHQPAKGRFQIAMREAELNTEVTAGGGKITSSLYQTGIASGVPPAILGTMINAYSYDVDFQREIQRGDRFNLVYEVHKNDSDEIAGYGKLLYASLHLGGQEKKVYHYASRDGQSGYYDENGQSVRKALLRTPINGARLSSEYGMRKHPILGYSKMHKGIDFAAPKGTPVFAAGDATVEFAGRKGSYGIYVKLRHNENYATAYAHLDKLSQNARQGKRVRQGEVIGYVGSTGASTGPHLHYEVLANGAQVNPKNLKFPTGQKLSGRELAEFKENVKQIKLLAARLIDNQPALASAE